MPTNEKFAAKIVSEDTTNSITEAQEPKPAIEKDGYIDTKSLTAEERELLVLRYVPLIRKIASNIKMKLPPNTVELKDLEQEGAIGLLNSLEKYDPQHIKKATFLTFAYKKIKWAIEEKLRASGHLKRPTKQKVSKVSAIMEENRNLEARGLEPLTEKEMRKKLGLKEKNYLDYKRLAMLRHSSLDTSKVENPPIDGEKLSDQLLHEKEIKQIFEKMLEPAAMKFITSKRLKSEKKYQLLLDLYYQCLVGQKSLKDFGIEHGKSQSRVSQLFKQLKEGIRAILESQGIKKSDIQI